MQKLFFAPGIFRLYLALLVVIQHCGLAAFGTMAVYVFYVLSGFWITSMWERRYRYCRAPYFTFLLSRFWRLAPVYILSLFLLGSLLSFLPIRWNDMRSYLFSPWWHVRSLAIVSSSSQPQFLVPAWSLDIEMQFYLLAPFILALIRPGTLRFFPMRVGLIVLMASGSLILFFKTDAPHVGRYLSFFLAGMLTYAWNWRPSGKAALVSAVLFVFAVIVLISVPGLRDLIGPEGTRAANHLLHTENVHLSAVGAMLLLPAIAYVVRLPSTRADRHFGNLAYSVYLFHYIPKMVMDNMGHASALSRPMWLLVYWSVVALGSVVLYWFFDRPIDTLRQRFVRFRLLSDTRQSGSETGAEEKT